MDDANTLHPVRGHVATTPNWHASLGFGGAAVGNLYRTVSDRDCRGALNAALRGGIDHFDTAPLYGFGLSETRLGLALKGTHARISTKVGRRLVPCDAVPGLRHGFTDALPFEPVFDYSFEGVMASFEASLLRLGVDRVDNLFAHDLGHATHGEAHAFQLKTFLDGGYRAMNTLKAEGRVGSIGLGVNEWEVCEEILAHADLDVILLAGRYTLLEQSALDSFLPLCMRRDVEVVIGGPFNSGALVNDASGAGLTYNYAEAPGWVRETVAKLAGVCRRYAIPLPAAALQFPCGHACVSRVVPGLASASEVDEAVAWSRLPIPRDLWAELQAEGLIRPDAPLPVAPRAEGAGG